MRLLKTSLILVFLAGAALTNEDIREEFTDQLSTIIASKIRQTEAQLWPIAKPIPAKVISRLPTDLKAAARDARYIDVSRASEFSLPYIVIENGKRAAVVVGKVVVFKTVPGTRSNRDMYLWTHEVYHLKQYADLGIDGFIRSYLESQFGAKPEDAEAGNVMENDADRAACRAFPVANPGYLERCP